MIRTDWIQELEWQKLLPGEMKEVAEIIGIENTLKLMEKFGKTHVYFTEKPLLEMKRLYIGLHLNDEDVRAQDLARMLNMSERYVFNVIAELKKEVDQAQLNIFGK
jgi:Mor family transcriptional regulator